MCALLCNTSKVPNLFQQTFIWNPKGYSSVPTLGPVKHINSVMPRIFKRGLDSEAAFASEEGCNKGSQSTEAAKHYTYGMLSLQASLYLE